MLVEVKKCDDGAGIELHFGDDRIFLLDSDDCEQLAKALIELGYYSPNAIDGVVAHKRESIYLGQIKSLLNALAATTDVYVSMIEKSN